MEAPRWWRVATWFFQYQIKLVVGGAVAVAVRLATGHVLLAVGVGLAVAYAVPSLIVLPLMQRWVRKRGGHIEWQR